MNRYSPKDFKPARKAPWRPVNTTTCPRLRIKHVCREVSSAEAAGIEERKARKVAAVEAAKREQLALGRRHAQAIADIEDIIRRGFGTRGGCVGPVSAVTDGVGAYLHEAAAAPLLSAAEETVLAKRIEAGGNDGLRARDELIRANLRLVVSVAKKYTNRLHPPR